MDGCQYLLRAFLQPICSDDEKALTQLLAFPEESEKCADTATAKGRIYLHLGQVEVGPRAAREELLGIVEEEERKVKDGGRHGLAVHVHVLLQQVPPARAHEQHRRLRKAAAPD